MNPLHFHLIFNHAPIVGLFISIVLMIWALIKKNESLKSISLVIVICCALATIPVYLTGEPSEEAVENIAGFTHDAIHEHEEAAEFALIAMSLSGVLALLSLISLKSFQRFAKPALYATLTLSIFTLSVMVRTGFLGGVIRHTEVHSTAPVVSPHSLDGGDKKTDEHKD
jgi:uncharacterized membrane protein